MKMENNALQILGHTTNIEVVQGSFRIEGLDELKKAITEEMKKYNHLIVAFDDKSYRDSKYIRADLNKLSKAIDDVRKANKNEYLEPLKTFEEQLNDIKYLVDTSSKDIDSAIKEYEQQLKDEKKKLVERWIVETLDGKEIDIPFKESWLNKTTKESDVKDDVLSFVIEMETQQKIKQANIKIVQTFCKNNNQNADAWIHMLEYHSADEVVEKIYASIQREKEKQQQYDDLIVKNNNTLQEVLTEPVEIIDEEKEEVFYFVSATKSVLERLEQFMTKENIIYKKEIVTEDDLPW